MDFTQIIKDMAQGLMEAFDYKLKIAAYDKTFKAEIIERVSDGKYRILYKHKYYTARGWLDFKNGELVRVCAPENNWSELFIQTADHNKAYAALSAKHQDLESRLASLSAAQLMYTTGTMNSLTEFVEKTAVNPTYMGMARFKDASGWTPAGANIWVRIIYVYQNTYNNGQHTVEGTYLLTWSENMLIGFVRGHGGNYTIKWKNLSIT